MLGSHAARCLCILSIRRLDKPVTASVYDDLTFRLLVRHDRVHIGQAKAGLAQIRAC
jgi:hypothetical protein